MEFICSRRLTRFPNRLIEGLAVIAFICLLIQFTQIRTLKASLKEMDIRMQLSVLNSGSKIFSNKEELINSQLQNLYEHYKSSGKLSFLDPALLNNTRKADKQILVFNRVPKVGGQTVMKLLIKLAERNNFVFHRDPPHRNADIVLGPIKEKEFAESIILLEEPCAFEKHIVFTNFTKFNLPTPIYIDLVRDPVERVISWFYYIRAPWYLVDRRQNFPDLPLPESSWIRKDFETCVLSGDPECSYIEGKRNRAMGKGQLHFLCGHEKACGKFNTQPALDKAKYAVENQYSVVGILEDMPTTLAVFEKYIPRFFAGATEIYNNDNKMYTKVNKNDFKPPVSEEVKNLVRQKFSTEVEFYNFCKTRLQSQFLAVNFKDFE